MRCGKDSPSESRTRGGSAPKWGTCRANAIRLSMCGGWGLWGRDCAQLSSANRVRMALNPQQDEDRSGLSAGLRLLRQPLPDFSQEP